jgi:hypothetical protein
VRGAGISPGVRPPVALGFRIKSGRAIAVAVAGSGAAPAVVLRCEVELCDPGVAATRQPYHAGFGTAREDQREIARLTSIIERCAKRSIAGLIQDVSNATLQPGQPGGFRAALVVGSVIDPAAVGNLHIRAHANEGRLFRTVVQRALAAHGIESTAIVAGQLAAQAPLALERTDGEIRRVISEFGRTIGAPWRADEKSAATAAWIALAGVHRRSSPARANGQP